MDETSFPTSFPTLSPTNSTNDDDSQPESLRNEALIVASLSIFFYGLLFCVSFYYYRKFFLIERVKSNSSSVGKYDQAKKTFFSCLMISSFLELPTYFSCLARDGPTDCEWQAPDQVIFWFFHLLALCGYACCIVIPCVLWSDMINKKDGKLFFSSFPYDLTKRYFQIVILLYFLTCTIEIFVTLAFWDSNNYIYYQETPTYAASAVTECTLILLISCGCLYCGIRLEMYVHDAKLNPTVEMKFLFTLNVILFVIVLSFVGRAVLILQFAPGVPESYQHPVNYAAFTLITRWTPDVLCQLLLVLVMRLSGNEATAKNSVLASSSNPMAMIKGRYGSSFFFPSSSSKGVEASVALKNPLMTTETVRDSENDSKDLLKIEDNLLPVFKVSDQFRQNMYVSTGSASEFRNEPFTSGNEDRHASLVAEAGWTNEFPSSPPQFASTPSDQLSQFVQRYGNRNTAGNSSDQFHHPIDISSGNPLHENENMDSYMLSSYGTTGQLLEDDERFSMSGRRFIISIDSAKDNER
eukprot:gene4372-4686_t